MGSKKETNPSDEEIKKTPDPLFYEAKLTQCFYGRLLQLYQMKQAEAKNNGKLILRDSLRTFLIKEVGLNENRVNCWKREYDELHRLAHPQENEKTNTQSEKNSPEENDTTNTQSEKNPTEEDDTTNTQLEKISPEENDTTNTQSEKNPTEENETKNKKVKEDDFLLQPYAIDEIVIAFNKNAFNKTNIIDEEFLRYGPIVYKIKKIMAQFGLEYFDIFANRVMAEDKFNKLMSGTKMFTAKDVENLARAFGVAAKDLLSCTNSNIGYGKSYYFTEPSKNDSLPTFLIGECQTKKRQRENYKVITDILKNQSFTLICSHKNLHWISHQTDAAEMNSFDDYNLTMEDAEKISIEVEKSKEYRTGTLKYSLLKPFMPALIYKINCLGCCTLVRSKENLWVFDSSGRVNEHIKIEDSQE